MSMADYFNTTPVARESLLARFSDLGLVAGVVLIVALMILPLQPLLIDMLVAVSIALGLGMLLVGIYIKSALEFSVFPSLLLMTTLFRLSLSIATTRMVLLEGHAGSIIDTFGKMVAGGNLVVGLVVFLIITVVQFIVIAKGAERVAEVAARFSLDAMPGKQLSIDSDLRSGILNKDEARRRRRTLELESKLHGSLDGAMKFVKGDAIASIVILMINLLGGLAIGVMQLDMDASAALQKYAILTIGDGMVAQIPALLGAMAAGLIVTRTTDDEQDQHLGDSIRKQILGKPRVLLVAGGILFLMAGVPGFPAIVFIALGLVSLGTGLMLTPASREWLLRHPALPKLIGRLDTTPPVTTTALHQLQASVPLLLRLPARRLAGNRAAMLAGELETMLGRFQLELGLTLPQINLHGEPEAAGNAWELLAYEVPIATGTMQPDEPAGAIVSALREPLLRQAALFLGVQDTTHLLTRSATELPDVIKEVLRSMSVPQVADVLRRLIAESMSIRNLKHILEALAEAGQREKDTATLTEFARVALRRETCHRFAPEGRLPAILLEPGLEEVLRQALRHENGVTRLTLDPKQARVIAAQFEHCISQHRRDGRPVAVVTAIDIRAHLRKLIEADCFETPVLSYHELTPTLQLDVLDRINTPPTALESS